ncbi:MAG: methionine--tRNA ligase [Planctomycetes bacterium]|nr:methionine--tRNA ligase [Planctomycetota bacterium]
MTRTKSLLVTSALPYANGPIHFGHLVGAYLPADIFVRYHRMLGNDVLYICGTDEHGVPITVNAEREGKPYQDYVDHWHKEIFGFLDTFGIKFDYFGQTSRREPHYQLSLEFFLRLLHNGRIQPREVQQHYCVKCDRFLSDRYVEGTCYSCGALRARGDECRKCTTLIEATRLIDPVCVVCRSTPEIRSVSQWELLLEGYPKRRGDLPDGLPGSRALQEWFDRFATRENLKPNVYSTVVTKLVEQEKPRARPITRNMRWGVPLAALPEGAVPGLTRAEAEEKVLYVWFDAPIGYISATALWAREKAGDPERWRRYWIRPKGEEGSTRLIHFLGKDNIPFHCIIFPAMLAWQETGREGIEAVRAALGSVLGPGENEAFVLPENVPANEFYNLEGRKFSTSDGWYIDPADFRARYDMDTARFALCRTMPETGDSDFTWREFQARTNELADAFGNLAARVLKFAERYFENKVPQGGAAPALDPELIRRQAAAVGEAIEGYSFRAAAERFIELARAGNKYFDEQQPWKTRTSDPAGCGAAIRECIRLLAALAGVGAPFIPRTAARLWRMLGLEGEPLWPGRQDAALLLPEGHALGKPEVLVPKISDDLVALEVGKLRDREGNR